MFLLVSGNGFGWRICCGIWHLPDLWVFGNSMDGPAIMNDAGTQIHPPPPPKSLFTFPLLKCAHSCSIAPAPFFKSHYEATQVASHDNWEMEVLKNLLILPLTWSNPMTDIEIWKARLLSENTIDCVLLFTLQAFLQDQVEPWDSPEITPVLASQAL